MNPETPPTTNSIGGLLHTLRDETFTLVQQELALAKTELRTNASRLGGHIAQIATGSLVAYAGVIVLLIGLGHLLGNVLVRADVDPVLAEWLAPAVVGAVVAFIGWAMLSKAKKAIANDSLIPRRTVETLKEDTRWAKTKLQPSP